MIAALLIAATVSAGAAGRTATPDSRAGLSPGSVTAMQSLKRAYETRDESVLAGLYTSNYEYYSTAVSGGAMKYFGRDDELNSAHGLFHGVVKDGKTVMPAADTIGVSMSGLSESDDPEHPDSLAFYRLVTCTDFGLKMKLPGNLNTLTWNSMHVFHLVRGDAAVLAEGQAADPKRWYIRRWYDDVNLLNSSLAEHQGDCTPASASDAAAADLRLAIQPLGNPACPTIDLMCVLPRTGPATIEVIDIAGRRVNRQTVDIAKPGPQVLQAGAGASIKPGAYFVRVSQGNVFATQKVFVAR